MEAGLAGERIAAAAERAGQPAVRRPDRLRRRRERLADFDVLTHDAQPALESVEQIAQYTERVFGRRERYSAELRPAPGWRSSRRLGSNDGRALMDRSRRAE